MDKKTIFVIHPHSIVDVITNSSTEIFCGVFSENKLDDLRLYLERVLGKKIELYNADGMTKFIGFSIEYGENEKITSEFIAILDELLKNTFGENNYEIRTDVWY